MKKLLCGLLLLVSAWAHSTLAGAASVVLGQAGAGGVSAIIAPDPGEIGRPANIWMGGVLNGILYLRNGPSIWAEYRGGPLPIALTSAALPSSLEVSIVNFDISSLSGLDVYVGYGSTEADLSLSGHLAKVYTTIPTPVATPVGVASGSAASATIGAAGGTVSAPDGKLALSIPAGALAADTVISIQPITNNAHGGLGAGYRLTPDGQTFAQPVVLTFSYTDEQLAGSDPEILGAAFQTAAGYWQRLGTPTIDNVAKTMRISTTHFTDFVMMRGVNLLPRSGTLNVNERLALWMVVCYGLVHTSEIELGLQCNTANTNYSPPAGLGYASVDGIEEWSVNGIAGGNDTVGTVSGHRLVAIYKAPATKPTPNVVTVSARWTSAITFRRNFESSLITISASPTYTGTVNFSTSVGEGAVTSSGTANVTWTQFEDLGDTRRYVPSGTITADITIAGCKPLHATVPIEATVPHGVGGTLVVHTASSAAFANSYFFGLAADPGTILAFTCGDNPLFTLHSPAPIAFDVGGCLSFEPQPFTDEAQLAGTYSCPETGLVNATWNFTAQ